MKKQILILLLLVFGKFSFAQVPFYIPTNGLVGWWPFNGNANDESGNGNNGTTMNGVTLTTDRNGIANKAYSFDGVDDYIISASVNEYLSDTISISFWINYASDFGAYSLIAFGGTPSIRWGAICGSSQLRATVGAGCIGTGNILNYTVLTGWHNVVYVIAGTNQLIYFDGNYVGTETNNLPSSLGCDISNLWFGVDIFSAAEYYNGKLDDIGIWNRILSPTEIQLIHIGTTGINELSTSNSLIVYPNPVSDELFITTNTKLPKNILLFDALGQKIKSWKIINSTFSASVKELKSGVYFITDDTFNHMTKIIKE